MTPTYLEQERHIHEQYIAGKIEPYEINFCFCGNLKGDRSRHYEPSWYSDSEKHAFYWPTSTYTEAELLEVEKALLTTIRNETVGSKRCNIYGDKGNHLNYEDVIKKHSNYENALFNGMVAALEVLKEIHIERGEVIDQPVNFTKRILQS